MTVIKFAFGLMILSILACGGSSSTDGSGTANLNDPCTWDGDCQAAFICENDICVACSVSVDGSCPQGYECINNVCEVELPTCSDTNPCTSTDSVGAGFNCSSQGQCLPNCVDDADCCPEGEDCTLYLCRQDGSGACDRTERVSDCVECTNLGWRCREGTTLHTCYIDDVCNRASEDCAAGEVCLSNLCSPCTSADQCPAGKTCLSSGLCGDLPPPDNSVNKVCTDDAGCTHLTDGFCSTSLNPRRCTISCSGNPGQARQQCRDAGLDDCVNVECVGSAP